MLIKGIFSPPGKGGVGGESLIIAQLSMLVNI